MAANTMGLAPMLCVPFSTVQTNRNYRESPLPFAKNEIAVPSCIFGMHFPRPEMGWQLNLTFLTSPPPVSPQPPPHPRQPTASEARSITSPSRVWATEVLFLGTRMRALHMDPVNGNPQRYFQKAAQ